MVSELDRRTLFTALETSLGRQAAITMMTLLPPVDWDDIARRSDIETMATMLRGEMESLRGEMDSLRGELRGEMDSLRGELRGEMGELRGEMGELRG
ncbi:MAG TPA: hypothetical protein VNT56_04700, partial [Acidimicrobiales bacterium]|nr:hypothetical protein [Acidimicrobiales bacterium]